MTLARETPAPVQAEQTGTRAPGSRSTAVPGAAGSLHALQRTAGNRAVAAALQRRTAPSPRVPLVPATPPAVAEAAARDGAGTSQEPATTQDVGPVAAAKLQRWSLGGIASSIGSAVGSVAGGVRDRVLQTLAGWARRMPGYELLCTVLGRDVVAGTPVPRNAAAIISGFLGLIPGGTQIRQNLQESGAITRAGEWLDSEVPKLGLTWDLIRGLFSRAWDALGPTDLLNPAGAWQRISGIFGPHLARLRDFAVAAGRKLLEFVFEGALSLAGGLGAQVMGIVRRAGGVLDQILKNPVGFAGNLVNAVKGGLGRFLTNIWTHLRNGLIGWLTGALGGVIRIPAAFNLRGILSLAMDLLGLTWQRVRGKLARLIGEPAVKFLEEGAGIVHDLLDRGLGAITDRISQFTSGIVDTVIGGIRDWVANSVVGAAITKLISMFNPAGAVIQAIIAVYNTIKFFIERAQQLGALANAVFDSIAAIASGNIGNAVQAVENALGRAIPVVLGFLSRLIGLGDIATPVRNVMTKVHTVIDQALDRVMGWIAGLARRAGGALRSGAERVRTGARAVGEALGIVRKPITLGAERHTLKVDPRTGVITMASEERILELAMAYEISRINDRRRAAQLPPIESDRVMRSVARQIVDARERIVGAREGKSAAARRQLDLLAPVIIDLLSQIGGDTADVADAPPQGLGRIASHRENSGSVPRDAQKPWLDLESEHVIPVALVSDLFGTLGDTRRIERGDSDDLVQTTILVYRGAARVKTYGASGVGLSDATTSSWSRAIRRAGVPNISGRGRLAKGHRDLAAAEQAERISLWNGMTPVERTHTLRTLLADRMAERVDDMVRSIAADHAVNGSKRQGPSAAPAEAQVRAAAARQVQDIIGIFINRLG